MPDLEGTALVHQQVREVCDEQGGLEPIMDSQPAATSYSPKQLGAADVNKPDANEDRSYPDEPVLDK